MSDCTCDQTYRNRDGVVHAFDCGATLVERLRAKHETYRGNIPTSYRTLEAQAADEIERLRARVVELEYTIAYAPADRMPDPEDKQAYLAARGVVRSDTPAEAIIREGRGNRD